MAEYSRNSKKSGSSRKTDSNAPDSSKRKFKLIAIICLAVLFLGLLTWCIIKLPGYFYTENPRLEFKNLEVDSTGYWQKNPEQSQELEHPTVRCGLSDAEQWQNRKYL